MKVSWNSAHKIRADALHICAIYSCNLCVCIEHKFVVIIILQKMCCCSLCIRREHKIMLLSIQWIDYSFCICIEHKLFLISLKWRYSCSLCVCIEHKKTIITLWTLMFIIFKIKHFNCIKIYSGGLASVSRASMHKSCRGRQQIHSVRCKLYAFIPHAQYSIKIL